VLCRLLVLRPLVEDFPGRFVVQPRVEPVPVVPELDVASNVGACVRACRVHCAMDAHFASYCGTAPIDVSSGDTARHRLSRAGDRTLNHALHIMAITQARGFAEGRAYYLRKRQARKSHNEALRCLKRRLSDVIYRQLQHDQRGTATGPGGQPGATLTSSAAGSTPTASSSDQSLPGPATADSTAASRAS
jgi:hypothetical protein